MSDNLIDAIGAEPDQPFIPENDELVAICKKLYRDCAAAKEVEDADDLFRIPMQEFVEWCNANDQPKQSRDQMVAHLNVRGKAVDFVAEVFQDPWRAMNQLLPFWCWIILQSRPPIRNSIGFLHIAITVGFRDGKVLQQVVPTPVAPGKAFSDGYLCALMTDQTNQLINTFAVHGFDKLYTEHAQYVGDEPGTVAQKPVPPVPPGRAGFPKPQPPTPS